MNEHRRPFLGQAAGCICKSTRVAPNVSAVDIAKRDAGGTTLNSTLGFVNNRGANREALGNDSTAMGIRDEANFSLWHNVQLNIIRVELSYACIPTIVHVGCNPAFLRDSPQASHSINTKRVLRPCTR